MTRALVVRAEAEQEIITAAEWYESRGSGLAAEFLRIDRCGIRGRRTCSPRACRRSAWTSSLPSEAVPLQPHLLSLRAGRCGSRMHSLATESAPVAEAPLSPAPDKELQGTPSGGIVSTAGVGACSTPLNLGRTCIQESLRARLTGPRQPFQLLAFLRCPCHPIAWCHGILPYKGEAMNVSFTMRTIRVARC